MVKHCVAAEPRYGEYWQRGAKDVNSWRKPLKDIMLIVAQVYSLSADMFAPPRLSVGLSVYLSMFVWLSACVCVPVNFYLFVYLHVCLSVFMSVSIPERKPIVVRARSSSFFSSCLHQL